MLDLPVLLQKHKNKLMELENDAFLFFADPMFVIEPIEGTIWPNSHVDVNVYFNPNTAGAHGKTVYCQVSGRETRLPLQLKVCVEREAEGGWKNLIRRPNPLIFYTKGDGIGPKARFSYDLLDMESLFVNTSHRYEVYKKTL